MKVVPANWLSPCGTDECADHSERILLNTTLGHAAVRAPSSANPEGNQPRFNPFVSSCFSFVFSQEDDAEITTAQPACRRAGVVSQELGVPKPMKYALSGRPVPCGTPTCIRCEAVGADGGARDETVSRSYFMTKNCRIRPTPLI
ncbi:hypothetical protein EVAR_2376_1 [Eumeta japonica]|uniref:Uncharacterized protein n=1 Tax=Eumeta variegata TaxID=151549 RepID=A0A4C1SGJ7_EUMVA|nr:hypothetical protein EVAR_2376_1 [Eumeta japonica]